MKYLNRLKLILLPLLLITGILGLAITAANATTVPGVVFSQASPQSNSAVTTVAYITGAVASPGLYEIDSKTTIADLVSRSGGFRDDVDSDFVSKQLNLAAIVTDHQHIDIPGITSSAPASQAAVGTSAKVNLNTASESELESLPGVGPSLAASIIGARPFKTVADLQNVKGIGDAKFAQIQALVTI